jgi:pterin-4a-carbinolamine dehydratase
MKAAGFRKESLMNEQTTVQKLKSERVQEPAVQTKKKRLPPPDDALGGVLAGLQSQAQQRLKSERVQLRLKRLPGWRMQPEGKAIDRVRQFSDPLVAALYLAFAGLLARQSNQPLRISMIGSTVCVALTGRSVSPGTGLTDEVLDLAEQLG